MESKRYIAGGKVSMLSKTNNGGILFSLDLGSVNEFFIENEEFRNRLLDVLGIEGRVQKSVDAINLLEEAKRDNLRVLVSDLEICRHKFCVVEIIEVPFWAHQFYVDCSADLKKEVKDICDAIESKFSEYEGKYLVRYRSEFLILEKNNVAKLGDDNAVCLLIERDYFNAEPQLLSRSAMTKNPFGRGMWGSPMITVEFHLSRNRIVECECLVDTGSSHSCLPAIFQDATGPYSIRGSNVAISVNETYLKGVEGATGLNKEPFVNEVIVVHVKESSAAKMKAVQIGGLFLNTICRHGILGRDVLFQFTGMWSVSEEGQAYLDLYNLPPLPSQTIEQNTEQTFFGIVNDTFTVGKSAFNRLREVVHK